MNWNTRCFCICDNAWQHGSNNIRQPKKSQKSRKTTEEDQTLSHCHSIGPPMVSFISPFSRDAPRWALGAAFLKLCIWHHSHSPKQTWSWRETQVLLISATWQRKANGKCTHEPNILIRPANKGYHQRHVQVYQNKLGITGTIVKPLWNPQMTSHVTVREKVAQELPQAKSLAPRRGMLGLQLAMPKQRYCICNL